MTDTRGQETGDRRTPCRDQREPGHDDAQRRSFAALLDEAERGQTVIVTRGGRRIATIGPATASNGADVVALLAGKAVDDDFAADVFAARDAVALEGPASPEH